MNFVLAVDEVPDGLVEALSVEEGGEDLEAQKFWKQLEGAVMDKFGECSLEEKERSDVSGPGTLFDACCEKAADGTSRLLFIIQALARMTPFRIGKDCKRDMGAFYQTGKSIGDDSTHDSTHFLFTHADLDNEVVHVKTFTILAGASARLNLCKATAEVIIIIHIYHDITINLDGYSPCL